MRAAAPDKPGGGLISEEELAEKNAATSGDGAAADGHMTGAEHAVVIEPVDANNLDKVFPFSDFCALLLETFALVPGMRVRQCGMIMRQHIMEKTGHVARMWSVKSETKE